MKNKIQESYTSASTFPVKLLHNEVMKNKKIKPLHIQIIPTNNCNLNCEFCSCSDRDKKLYLTMEQIEYILETSKKYGSNAVTITGGGEPLLHPRINDMIEYMRIYRMEAGLVTNGVALDKLKRHDNLTWVRVSSSDDRIPEYSTIEKALKVNPDTDWAFSHVVTEKPNYEIIRDMISFANDNNFSHIRLVSDLYNVDKVPNMSEVKKKLKGIDDKLVIYQGRKDSTLGIKDCYISLLKPVISPEGIFPCCGVQYATAGQRRDMVAKMKMGEVEDLDTILSQQEHFDGSKCDVCYYSQYNDALSKIKEIPNHRRFV